MAAAQFVFCMYDMRNGMHPFHCWSAASRLYSLYLSSALRGHFFSLSSARAIYSISFICARAHVICSSVHSVISVRWSFTSRAAFFFFAPSRQRPLSRNRFMKSETSEEWTTFVSAPSLISLYYRIVVIRASLQGLCYTVRDAVDWFGSPTTRWFTKGSNHSPLQFC